MPQWTRQLCLFLQARSGAPAHGWADGDFDAEGGGLVGFPGLPPHATASRGAGVGENLACVLITLSAGVDTFPECAWQPGSYRRASLHVIRKQESLPSLMRLAAS